MIETPFNYTGSKFKLLEQLLPFFDYSKPYFVEIGKKETIEVIITNY